MNTINLYIKSSDEMMALGGKIAAAFPQGGLVFLNGDLGTGKTTLVRGLLRSLGFKGTVKSPTYALVEPYHIAGRDIYHFDLYRLADPEELEYMGVRDYLSSEALCLIEWSEKAQSFLPAESLSLFIQHDGEARKVSIEFADHIDIKQ